MREVWFSHRVYPEGLEPSTNGLREHCYDTPTTDIIDHIDIALEIFPSNMSKKQIKLKLIRFLALIIKLFR